MSTSSSSSSPPDGAVEVAVRFVANYDNWAQSGYADPIPASLREISTSNMLRVFEDDQSWYLTGGVQQHGDVKIVETELTRVNDDSAVVTITLDASAVTVTAEGEETFVDYSKPIVTRFTLERGDVWRVDSTETDH